MSDYKFTQNSVSITMTEDYVRQWEATLNEYLEAGENPFSHIIDRGAWERIDRMVSVHSIPDMKGTIDRSAPQFWRTKSY